MISNINKKDVEDLLPCGSDSLFKNLLINNDITTSSKNRITKSGILRRKLNVLKKIYFMRKWKSVEFTKMIPIIYKNM